MRRRKNGKRLWIELESIHKNDVWDLVKLPSGRKPVGSKWVFKRKLNDEGAIERYNSEKCLDFDLLAYLQVLETLTLLIV